LCPQAAGLLQCVAGCILPSLPPTLTPDQQQQAAAFVEQLLTAFTPTTASAAAAAATSTTSSASASASTQEVVPAAGLSVYNAAASAALQLLGRCDAALQKQPALTACEWLAGAASAAAAASSSGRLGPEEQARAGVAAALLTVLQPAVLDGASRVVLLEALVVIASSATCQPDVAEAAAVAFGAVVAKAQAAGGGSSASQGVLSAAGGVLEGQLLPLLALGPEHPPSSQIQREQQWLNALRVLGWLLHALALAASPRVPAILSAAAAWLAHAGTAASGRQGQPSPQAAAAAAQGGQPSPREAAVAALFRLLLSDAASVGTLRLAASMHCKGKVLWQQRAFTQALEVLALQLQQLEAQGPQAQRPLLLAAGELLSAAPGAVLASSLDAALPLLLHCLRGLPQPAAGADGQAAAQQLRGGGGARQLPPPLARASPAAAQLLGSCLGILAGLLSTPAERLAPSVEPHVGAMVQALLPLVLLPAAPSVREAALSCLAAAQQLPYYMLHPHRSAVLAVASRAADDGRRSVRAAAVRCKRVWSS
jgi:hypothetical protein